MRFVTVTALFSLILCGAASSAQAADAPAPPAMQAASGPAVGMPSAKPANDGGWKPYDYKKGAPKDQVASGTLVVLAYVILWAVLLGYVLLLATRQRRLEADLSELRRQLPEALSASSSGEGDAKGDALGDKGADKGRE